MPRILILAKTYPTVSRKYAELVCTAGMLDDGNFVRIYPVPFRSLPYSEQYKKWEYINIGIEKNTSDGRPETYRRTDSSAAIQVTGKLDTNGGTWRHRLQLLQGRTYTDMSALIAEAKNPAMRRSIAFFRPSKITGLVVEKAERNWDRKTLDALRQANLFDDGSSFKPVKKLPFDFSYSFIDSRGKKSTLLILDWEIGQLYWNCLRKLGNEQKACEAVKAKYLTKFNTENDVYFLLGTTKQHHFTAKNPFLIISVLYPKKQRQGSML